MEDLIAITPQNHQSDDDLEALELFNQMGGELSSSLPRKQPEADRNIELSDQEEAPVFSRLSKQKKENKKDRKKKKMREKLKTKSKKHRGDHASPAPKKKIKRDPSTKKKTDKEDADQSQRHDDKGSSEFDSDSEDNYLELKNLNPDLAEEDPSPKKRLKKSGRKENIQNKQGFRIEQLGNDPQFDQSSKLGYSDDDYSGDARKKRNNKKKSKVAVPTNEEIMNIFKQHGVVQSEGEEESNRDYDRGFSMLQTLNKKSKDSISIKNRLFGDLQINLQKEEAQVIAPQNFELELKPKSSTVSSIRNSFFSKAEGIKKSRGIEAEVNAEEYQKKVDEKAKKSMAKIITSLASQDYHEDLDLQVRVPTVARGKSAGLINNTVFLRSELSRRQSEEQDPFVLKQTKSLVYSNPSRKQMSRQELFRQIQEQTRLRRSKYISNEQLKNSFKKTNLQELEEFRKKIQEKKRKEALSQDDESEEEEMDSEMKQMIEKEQKMCGDLEEEEEEDGDWKPAEDNEQVKQLLEQEAVEQLESEHEQQKQVIQNQQLNEVAQEQLEQFNQILDELHSVSKSIQQAIEHQQQEEGEEGQNNEESQLGKVSIEPQDMESHNIEPVVEIEMTELDIEKEKEMQELEEEGIMIRKRRRNFDEKEDVKDVEQRYLAPSEIEGEQPEVKHQKMHVLSASKDKVDELDQQDQFNNFKKLRRIAVVIARKKKEREIGRQYASQFVENEAEEGSDNEDHDDIVKHINREDEDKEYEGLDLDADLVELIDNAVDIKEEDQYEAFRKYLQDVRMQDRDEIRKIVRGQFWKKHEDLQIELQEDERKRQQRMQEVMNWMKQREDDEGEGIYMKEPEREEKDSDEDSEERQKKDRQKLEDMQDQSGSEELDPEQQMVRLTKYLEDTMPSTKKEYKPVGSLNLFPLPESVKRENSKPGSQKTISMSKFGSFTGNEINHGNLMHKKSTSSLVNQILNKTANKPRKPVANLLSKTQPKKK